MKAVGIVMLLAGLCAVGYFLFVYDVAPQTEAFSLRVMGEILGEARFQNTDPERVEFRRSAVIAGAALTVAGAVLFAAGQFAGGRGR